MLKTGTFLIGNTPLINLKYCGKSIYIKCEFFNLFGSMKDRAAAHIISRAFELGLINNKTTIVESSSGNFGIALAAMCRQYGLRFICVIDSNTNKAIERLLFVYGAEIIKITEADEYGGYLLNRLAKVKEILSEQKNIYWTNQYENPLNAEAYHQLADEVLSNVNCPDYIFIPVSSGGTVTGVSFKVKEKSPNTKIIAVDSKGSVIFGGQACKRHLPGMGSSIVPLILQKAKIDDVVVIEETDMIRECRKYFNNTGILIGGSSGACLCAIQKYLNYGDQTDVKIVTIFPDKGERYIETIYNDNWCREHFMLLKAEE